MTTPYEFSRRVRELADDLRSHTQGDLVRTLRALANEFDHRVARYESEIGVLKDELRRRHVVTSGGAG